MAPSGHAALAGLLDLLPQLREGSALDGRARALEQPHVEAQVVKGGEPRPERFAALDQVAQVRARVVRAGGAINKYI